jgi:hypothetical protein
VPIQRADQVQPVGQLGDQQQAHIRGLGGIIKAQLDTGTAAP